MVKVLGSFQNYGKLGKLGSESRKEPREIMGNTEERKSNLGHQRLYN